MNYYRPPNYKQTQTQNNIREDKIRDKTYRGRDISKVQNDTA